MRQACGGASSRAGSARPCWACRLSTSENWDYEAKHNCGVEPHGTVVLEPASVPMVSALLCDNEATIDAHRQVSPRTGPRLRVVVPTSPPAHAKPRHDLGGGWRGTGEPCVRPVRPVFARRPPEPKDSPGAMTRLPGGRRVPGRDLSRPCYLDMSSSACPGSFLVRTRPQVLPPISASISLL